ncbi:uncharacterized protein Nmag_2628 [Natrialba magadii ATCC 43099]|uniref:Uncharacterized protein n=1 Tax=Natrialba magadii (strain ATCC 43099 / DSM 3394 / CCM 3739 / CIP 104546 / IAM 13178 / JCM 8861 / NBRC 102185 / NCIMB 2190 / MS3) TaxID=547559 RepID=D3SYZ5_NATMM|nr:uncharacterized protein Nmag_2628 [Natrialba magadii ATCC 43099]
MKRHTVIVIAVVIPLFVLVSAGSLGFYLSPYEPLAPEYAVAHESTNAFDDVLENQELETDNARHVGSLSPSAQRVFEDATDRPPEVRGGVSGWQIADVSVCQDTMLVCDAVRDPPLVDDGTYTVVEQDDELYVVETQQNFPPALGTTAVSYLTFALVAVFAGLLALVGYKHRDARTLESGLLAAAAIGVTVGLWPYLLLVAGIASYWWLVLPLICLGIGLLVRQIQLLFQYAEARASETRTRN